MRLVQILSVLTLGTLFAGIQLAITQPIRLDDVVIVEGGSGSSWAGPVKVRSKPNCPAA